MADQVGTPAELIGDPHRIDQHVVGTAREALAKAWTVHAATAPSLLTKRLLFPKRLGGAAKAALHAAVDDEDPGSPLAPRRHLDRRIRMRGGSRGTHGQKLGRMIRQSLQNETAADLPRARPRSALPGSQVRWTTGPVAYASTRPARKSLEPVTALPRRL